MDNRTNTIFMMTLGAAIIALGGTIISGEAFRSERPEKMGYVVEGVEAVAGAEAGPVDISIAALLPTADPAKGAEVFKKCASCHVATAGGANGIGPGLYGVLGKPHAVHPGFAYSDALKGKPGNWDFASMNEWLHSPKAYAPGTKMSFAGLSKNEDRANVIAYLNTLGSNLPVPAAPAAGAAPAADAAAGNAAEGNATAPADNAAAPAASNATAAK